MEITVVGAGVVGLSTARILARDGHRVRVVADRAAEESTSGAAGAIWFPYLAEPAARVAEWGRASYRWLSRLAREQPEAGVVGAPPLYVAVDDDRRPVWASALPDEGGLEYLPASEVPAEVGALFAAGSDPPRGAWRFPSPVVDPARHLAWLRRDLEIQLDRRRPVTDLEEVPGDRVVNCTGARAGRLTRDPELCPTLGQVILDPDGGRRFARFSWADERNREELVYAFARAGESVLGGCSVAPDDPGGRAPWETPGRPEPRADLTEAIRARWRRAGVDPPASAGVQAGWRPVRTQVRLERRGRVVHNYGHGGAGFTLAYGCALEVARIVDH
ncbi:MAG: FAD-dependent oxidoreductase [Thermoanaerobaculia bacterium]|nr:FAD-dependent oxidoreductase [Thermoanaerobaculia bacterium]